MSQEIRTEMNSIVGLTYLLEESASECIRNTSYSNQVFKACNRLIKLFEDFFDTEIAEKINSPHRFQRFNLKSLTESLYSDLREYLEQNNKSSIILITDSDYADDVELYLDRSRISRILHYLFQNSDTNDKMRYIKTGSKYKDGKVTFYVLDPQQDFELCKGYFSSEENYSSDSEYYNPRTSINFTLARKNVKLLKGRIWIEPFEHTGTGFYFSIPCQRVLKNTIHIKELETLKSI